jgi:hypothetical protein
VGNPLRPTIEKHSDSTRPSESRQQALQGKKKKRSMHSSETVAPLLKIATFLPGFSNIGYNVQFEVRRGSAVAQSISLSGFASPKAK